MSWNIYPIVVTVGLKSTFAYIGSSKGSFEMVGNREFGWLMPTEAMERHVDYEQARLRGAWRGTSRTYE